MVLGHSPVQSPNPGNQAVKSVLESRARAIAARRLAELHPYEWQVLLEAAREELGLTT